MLKITLIALAMLTSLNASAAFHFDSARLTIPPQSDLPAVIGRCGGRGSDQLPGFISIKEYDNETITTKETFIPVDVRILDRGLMCKVSGVGTWTMELITYGHSVSDLFGRYIGGTIGVAAVLNFDATLLVNPKSGVVLKDLQDLFGGLGVQAARRDILIQPRGTGPANVVVEVTSQSSNQTNQQKTTLDQVLGMQLR